MIASLLLGLCLAAASPPAGSASATERPASGPAASAATRSGKAAKPAPDPGQAPPADAPSDPKVRAAVERMQQFYEQTRDFEARFHQTYKHKTFGRTTKAQGIVRFLKSSAAMRWDYLDDKGVAEKVFVISGKKVYTFDKRAKQLTVAGIDTERLSASITFLWGQGKLEREFTIRKADRPDLKDGVALELTPRNPDPRFQKVYFLLDPQSFAVRTTLVVDPDGSENRVSFSQVKTNSGFGTEVFHLEPPADTQIIRLDEQAGPQR